MKKTSIYQEKGVFINEGINRREIKLLASPKSKIKRDDFAMGLTIIEPGKIHEAHEHNSNEEIVFVYEGKGIANIGDISTSVEKGDLIGIDYNEAHSFTNTGDEDLVLLWVYSPPGIADEKFYIDN